ncbi:MAG TPA: O-antigen ligase family protein [Opitutales bacterium]|nr:O-antigen ligase family protein [Opitutales bacterium]
MNFKRSDLVLFIFFLNVLVSLTSGVFSSSVMHVGTIRALLMIGLIPLLMIDRVRLTWAGAMIFICLIYFVIMATFSSNLLRTFDILVKVAISLLMFVLAYNYLRGEEARRRLIALVEISLALFIFSFGLAQIFGIGVNPYAEDGLNPGAGNIQQTYLIAYFLLFLPLAGFFRGRPFKLHWWEGVLFLLSLFPLVLIARRGAILGFLAGGVIYAILTAKKARVVAGVGCAVFLGIVTMPLYIDHVHAVMEHRTMETEAPNEMGRVQELENSLKVLRDGDIKHALFGQELFNYVEVTRDFRDLHTDYATYFLGGGLVGFVLYFSIIPALWLDFWRRMPLIPNLYILREVSAVFIGLTAAYFIISFSGQYYVISSLAILFTLWGALLAYVEELHVPSEETEEIETPDMERVDVG